jgi:hypothetical protein
MTSACVAHNPWGAPAITFRLPFLTSFTLNFP